jgi:anti-sigma factor RsiW
MKPQNDAEQREFLISQYIDGALDDATRDKVHDLVETDPEWTNGFKRYLAVDDAVREHGHVSPDVNYDAMRRSITQQRRQLERLINRRRLIIRIATPLAAAASIAIVLVAMSVTPTTPDARPDLATAVHSGWYYPAMNPDAQPELFVTYGGQSPPDDLAAIATPEPAPVVVYASSYNTRRVYVQTLADIRHD